MTDCKENSNKEGAVADLHFCSSAFRLNIVVEIVQQGGKKRKDARSSRPLVCVTKCLHYCHVT